MATAVKSKAPTGLAIKRNKNTYTLTWKKGDKDYGDGQTCVFRCNNDKFANQTVSAGTTSKSVAVDYSNYYPNTSKMLSRVQFGIRGNRKAYTEKQKISGKDVDVTINPTISDWRYKEFTFNKPSTPSGSASLSQTHSNVCTFSWSEKVDTASHTHFADCQYQSILVKNCTEAKGDKQRWSTHNGGWMTNTTSATGSITITEQTELLAVDSYTRWVRVRARGARGASAWRYLKHVYARPNQAKIKTAKVKQTDAGGYLCSVEWVVGAGAAHPIDKVTVQYALAVPMAGMECPDGASWTDASITRDTIGLDKAAFSIDTTVGDDQCLFVRVNTEHDTNVTYGAAKAATVGYLADPTGLSVSSNPDTHLATVTAENTSDVPDSYLLIRYISADYPEGKAIGIIPHGEPDATVQCPAWASGEAIGFSVQAVVGAYVTSTDADGVTVYTVTQKMRSRNRLTYGGSVPQPPSNVSLAMTDTVGTIQVTFNWAWQDARAAELSWANHADAWQSTEEPDTYTINNTNASVWNISGLEVGQTWYVRVRLVGGTEDNPTYGGYSDTVSINLASEPITPVLSLSSGVITDGGSVTASWVYVSTDTTLQAEAHVAEVADTTQPTAEYVVTSDTAVNVFKTYYARSGNGTSQSPYVYKPVDLGVYTLTTDTEVTDGKQYYLRTGSGTASSPYVYTLVASPTGNPQTSGYYEFDGTYSSPSGYYEQNYRIIASTETAQNVTINASEIGWTTGEEHALAVRVVSASGRETGWSDPVSVMVAEPLVCEITQTSLEARSKNLVVYPYTQTTKTAGGITWTDNGDGTITANGTATTDCTFLCDGWTIEDGSLPIDPDTSYILTGSPNGASGSTYFVACRIYTNGQTPSGGTGTVKRAGVNGVTFSGAVYASVYLGIKSGNTVEDLVFRPMLQLASDADTTYELYNPVNYLTVLPLTVTVTGAGEGGTTTVAIERLSAYHVTRPDEVDLYGFEGETVALLSQMGEAQMTIGLTDLIGRLDDGAPYRLTATVSDGLGQRAEQAIDFWVDWSHQAIIPDGEVTLNSEHMAMMIVPIEPTGAVEGDVCDIYRLSTDNPQLIYAGANWGDTYVDPYPTLGEHGGYRFVFRTKDGDYITQDGEMAWADVNTDIQTLNSIIDYGGGQIRLLYNITMSSAWKKDFKETKYLGGSIQGDWNAAVSRTGSVGAVAITLTDQRLIEEMRRLAVYPGICNIRTRDGSSYHADIQVSESYNYKNEHKIPTFSLSITRIDSEELDGMTLEEWNASHQQEV